MKDKQIGELTERARESNHLIAGLMVAQEKRLGVPFDDAIPKDFLPAIARRRARSRTGPWPFCKLRDDAIVPLICPTCQNVFAGSLKAAMPATTMLLCMGLFSIF